MKTSNDNSLEKYIKNSNNIIRHRIHNDQINKEDVFILSNDVKAISGKYMDIYDKHKLVSERYTKEDVENARKSKGYVKYFE